MSDAILLVDDAPETLAGLRRTLEPDHRVETAGDVATALRMVERGGPFAVVVSDYDLPRSKGGELLARVAELSPDSVLVLLTRLVDVDVAIEALHQGRIFRFLEKPCARAALSEAIAAALTEHRQRVARRERQERLDFSAQVLQLFNGELDERLNAQVAALSHLQRYVGQLGRAASLEHVAELASMACTSIVPRRAVAVELWSTTEDGRVHAAAGPALGVRRHVQPVETPEGQSGTLVVDCFDAEGRRLSQAERNMFAAVASTTAVAVHNLTRRRERDEAQHAAILALAKLAEQRDNETGKHLDRVSLYCRLIAEGLRELPEMRAAMDERFMQDLVRSAPLHDIGKVGIPDSILLKPGKLSREEWETMKTHTTLGAQTLGSAMPDGRPHAFLEMSRDIAWCHHERWDGSGYPRGLAAEAIPIAARILALADVYDALTSVRPYKGAWPHEEAMRWIAQGAGSHFDTRIVQVFLQRHAEVDAIRERLADRPEELRPPLGVRGAA